jgi:energy-coupling factor transport system ATP-binding protein
MIRFERVSFTYPGATRPTISDVDLQVDEGELCLTVGETGAGKSTLLRAVNGLVPHFTGGTLLGRVSVNGIDTSTAPPRELADIVGVVGQDPPAGFVTDTVEDELAYVLENLGVPPAVMRRRVEDVLDLLGIAALRARPLATLSSGEAQRVAIGSVLTASPRVIVLDEPTSALDPGAAEEVFAVLTRLVDDLGLTVLLAEHRLERVVQYAHRIVTVREHGRVAMGDPAAVMSSAPVAPPVVELGRLAGWAPLPLSVRDARRVAAPLRTQLAARVQPEADAHGRAAPGEVVASTKGLTDRYGIVEALRGVDVTLRRGEVVALMGRNGAGKSTLLKILAGMRAPVRGRVSVLAQAPHAVDSRRLVRLVGLVIADPAAMLYERTVAEECAVADREQSLAAGTTRATLERIHSGVAPQRHPRDLSEGERLSLAPAIVLAPAPPLILLDEPTRGLDYSAKTRLGAMLRELAAAGHCVVLASHDVELVADVATRAVVLADGEVVSDGAARDVVCHSPVFAPQVAKILAPSEWLTVGEVAKALAS